MSYLERVERTHSAQFTLKCCYGGGFYNLSENVLEDDFPLLTG